MKFTAPAALLALTLLAPLQGARANGLAVGIDPMVLEFAAPYGGAARANVSVTNSSSTDEVVYATPIDWRTSDDGAVLFERPGAEREHSLTASLKLEPGNFILHAGETREISISLQMPRSAAASGALWGGFIVRAAASGAANASAMPGGTILVYDTVGSPRKHVAVTALHAFANTTRSIRLAADLLNDGATYVRPLVRVLVQRGSRVVREQSVPCSVIFAGNRRRLAIPLEGLEPGAYRIQFLVDYGGDTVLDGETNAKLR